MKIEQSNELLRRLSKVIEYLARVNIIEDNFSDPWFNDNNSHILLE